MSPQAVNIKNPVPKPLYVRNFPYFGLPHFDPKTIAAAMDYRPKDGDVILCSYPKTGTTWMQYIIWIILHNEEPLQSFQDMQLQGFPYIEYSGIEAIELLTTPRCFKTHVPYPLLNINKQATYIYIHRNPMDTLLSNFHFEMNTSDCSFTFDDYFESFMKGEIPCGDYFDHVLSFELHKDDPHLHMFSYEELHKDKKGQILRLAKILGDEYHQALMEDEELMQKLLDATSFHYMKQNVNTDILPRKDNSSQMMTFNMFRKGLAGEGKKALSSEQIDRLNQKLLTKMRSTRFVSMWSE